MTKIKKDRIREHRIDMEIIVDAHDEVERAMGWYYHLDGKLCTSHSKPSVSQKGQFPL
jgi:hypothetical protein